MSRRFWACLAAGVSLGVLLPAVPAAAGREPHAADDAEQPTHHGDHGRSASRWRGASRPTTRRTSGPAADERGRVHAGRPAADDAHPDGTAADTTHAFSVYAIDAAGNRSANSDAVSYATPPDPTSPSPQPILTATALFPTRFSVAWPAPGRRRQPRSGPRSPSTGARTSSISSARRTATVSNPDAGAAYGFQVTIRDASGNVNVGKVLDITTPAVNNIEAADRADDLRVTSQELSTRDLAALDPVDRQRGRPVGHPLRRPP